MGRQRPPPKVSRMSLLRHPTRLALATGLLLSATAHAQSKAPTLDANSLQQLRQQIDDLKRSYDSRIQALEAQLQQAQQQLTQQAAQQQSTAAAVAAITAAPAAPNTANVAASDTAADSAGAATGSANRFNPAVALILTGGYAGLSKSPDTWQLSGFLPSGGEVGPGKRGFSLGESELTLSANIDHLFYGAITLAVSGEDTISAAWKARQILQTLWAATPSSRRSCWMLCSTPACCVSSTSAARACSSQTRAPDAPRRDSHERMPWNNIVSIYRTCVALL